MVLLEADGERVRLRRLLRVSDSTMPFEQMVQTPPVRYQHDVTWPETKVAVDGVSLGQINRGIAYGGSLVTPYISPSLAGAGSTEQVGRFPQIAGEGGILCAELFANGAGRQAGITFQRTRLEGLVTDQSQMNPSLIKPEWMRVWLMNMMFGFTSAFTTEDDDTGIVLIADGTLSLLWPTGGIAAFGIVGDGAGGLRFRSYSQAAFPGNVIQTVAVPAAAFPDATEWNLLQMQIINSGIAQGDAELQVSVNGTLVTTQQWVGVNPLPVLPNTTAAQWILRARVGEIVNTMAIGPTQIQTGRNTAAGVPITN